MKIIKEDVIIEPGKSFRIFTPSFRNYFMWHYHPEFELAFVEASTGIRHVGRHISSYVGSDLILIGSNVPHLNFDYGLQTEYKQIVVQLKENFQQDVVQAAPEFSSIEKLFERAGFGLSFSGKTKETVALRLREMFSLNHFEQLWALMEIFQHLAESNEVEVLNDENISFKFFLNDKVRMGTVYQYIDVHFNEKPNVNEIAEQVHLTTAAFCRYFKKQTKMTFTDFVNQYRINHAKNYLLQDKSISEACYAVGFESLSYFNKLFRKVTGENPTDFKKRYKQNLP
jgi:AraC-like DNA-binding protein